MDQTTNPSEAAAASSPLPDERLRLIEASPWTVSHVDTAAMSREILRLRRDCPPTAEVELLQKEAAHQRWNAKQHLQRLPDGVRLGDVGEPPLPLGIDEIVGKLVDELVKQADVAEARRIRMVGYVNEARSERDAARAERDDLRLIAERNVGEMAKMASERVELQKEVDRLRIEKKSEVATAIEHLRRAGIIAGSPTAGPTPGVAIGEPMTLASTIGMLCDERAKILAGLGREAKALLEASFMLRCAAGRHPMPSPRVEETFGIFEGLRKLCDERGTAMHEADAWKHKADTLGGDLNRIRALVPFASDEQTTFDAVQAELRRLRGDGLGDALNFGLKTMPALPAEAQTAMAAMRDVGPELAKAGIQVGPRCSHAEAVAQLRGERDRWRERCEAANQRVDALERFEGGVVADLAKHGFFATSNLNGVRHAIGTALAEHAIGTALAELTRLRKESKRDQVGKQQALLDEIARLLPGKGPLLERVRRAAKAASDDAVAQTIMTGLGIEDEARDVMRQMLDVAFAARGGASRAAVSELAQSMFARRSLPAKEGPLPGSFCGTNQPQMPPLKADAPCGYKPGAHRDDFTKAPNFAFDPAEPIGSKVGPATGQPRTEAPLAADGSGTIEPAGWLGERLREESDEAMARVERQILGSGTVLDLGEAFRVAMRESGTADHEGQRLRWLRDAVTELAKVVERIGAR